jgi:lactoylglutathione lyase
MRIEHVAVWTRDSDRLKAFYERYFKATAGPKYFNPVRQLETYFLSFQSGARLEIMSKANLSAGQMDNQTCGWTHIALLVGTPQDVDHKADFLRNEGWLKVGRVMDITKQSQLILTETESRSWPTSANFRPKLFPKLLFGLGVS